MKWLGGFVLFLTLSAQTFGQAAGRVESVGFDGLYRPGCWTPMRVVLSPGELPTDRYILRVTQRDLDGDRVHFDTPITLTAGAGDQSFWTYFLPEPVHQSLASGSELPARLVVTLHEENGDELLRCSVANLRADSIDPLDGGTRRGRSLVIFVGEGARPNLAEFDPRALFSINEDLVPVVTTAERLPDRSIGFEGVDSIVWLDGDPAALSASGSGRLSAIGEWVRLGGHLVICTPRNGRQLSAFGALMPVDVVGQIELPDFRPLEGIARARDFYNATHDERLRLREPGSPPPAAPPPDNWDRPAATIRVGRAVPRDGAVVDVSFESPVEGLPNLPWLVRRATGFGAVTWVAHDLGDRTVTATNQRGWSSIWPLVLGQTRPGDYSNWPMFDPTRAQRERWSANGIRELGNVFAEGLSLSLLTASLVLIAVLFFIVYWVVAGPGIFFWLRSRGRSHLSWYCFGLSSVVATLLTLGVVRLVLRGEPKLKHVTLARIDCTGATPTRVMSRIGLYIPRDGNREISLPAGEGLANFLVPLPAHPKFIDNGVLVVAPLAYDIRITDESLSAPEIAVPYRSTLKRLLAEYSGGAIGRLEGDVTPLASRELIDGALRNATDFDLKNVYFAFRQQLGEAVVDQVLYVRRWNKGETLDLGTVFNPAGADDLQAMTVRPGVRIEAGERWRGDIAAWADHVWHVGLVTDALTGMAADFGRDVPHSVPLLSFFGRIPPMERFEADDSRTELLRSGLRDFDASAALAAGKMIVVAQVDNVPIQSILPLSVDGDLVNGAGRLIVQFFVPMNNAALAAPQPPTH